jgi:hypothetical protein
MLIDAAALGTSRDGGGRNRDVAGVKSGAGGSSGWSHRVSAWSS